MRNRGMCSIDGCWRHAFARTWCPAHYSRWYRHGDPLTTKHHKYGEVCEVPECPKKHYARGVCFVHYNRARRAGIKASPDTIRHLELKEAQKVLSRYGLLMSPKGEE